MKKPPTCTEHARHYRIVDAKDHVRRWYESAIIDEAAGSYFVHYIGWENKWDEWICKGSSRIALRGTHTDGPRTTTDAEVYYCNLQSKSDELNELLAGAICCTCSPAVCCGRCMRN